MTDLNLKPSMIVGAGLAGLLAAYAWPNIPIVEAAKEARSEHKALLRFRSDAVSRLTGIEFRRVLVRKGVWYRGAQVAPTIALANAYARKVTGILLGDRSIWNLDPAERYVAPETLYEQLIDAAGARIEFGATADFKSRAPIVSTAPMPVVMAAVDMQPELNFHRSSIDVMRYRVPGCDLFQTIYYPDPNLFLYRASITGDLLICEFMRTGATLRMTEADAIRLSFGIDPAQCVEMDRAHQKYGKIVELQADVRKSILFSLSHDHNIYSLGRFATWRNVLLDDVVSDIDVIKRLLKTGDKYDVARARAS